MLSKPLQQSLACLAGLLVMGLMISLVIQPMFRAAEAEFARRASLQFEDQRIKRALEANGKRSTQDLEDLRTSIEAQLFAGGDINDAQGAVQSLLSAQVKAASGKLSSMRLGDTQNLKSGLTAITLDVTASVREEQLMELLNGMAQAPQTLHVSKFSAQKKASYDDADTQVTLEMRVVGYWRKT